MKHIITYSPRQKDVLEYAIHMALVWHEGDVEPVCKVLYDAFKRHNPMTENLDEVFKQINDDVTAIREIDTKGENFGNTDILAAIKLSEDGESVITEQKAWALEHLSELVARLLVGQVGICFEWCNIPHIAHQINQELRRLTESLHTLCWNMPLNASYGIGYTADSDILWDIYQVLRHERYLNFSEEDKKHARWTVMADTPLHTSSEPLMGIKTIQE